MRLELQKPRTRNGELALGLLGLVVLAVSALLPVDRLLAGMGYRCHFRAVTGVPCLSCGATRAFVAAGRLRFGHAFRVNPLAAALFLAIGVGTVYALVCVLFKTRAIRIVGVTRRHGWLLCAGAALLVLGNWAYMIIRHTS